MVISVGDRRSDTAVASSTTATILGVHVIGTRPRVRQCARTRSVDSGTMFPVSVHATRALTGPGTESGVIERPTP